MPEGKIVLPSQYRGLDVARPTPAYAKEYCRRITKDHYENFPVASILIPKRLRQDVCNIYAFARAADDYADETAFEDARMKYLDEWEAELELAYEGGSFHPVFVALEETIKKFSLPKQLFLDLIKAFKMDVIKDRYKNFDEVLYYCRHSANPVGRLILLLFGYNNEEWFEWSDNICTALQLANFWQDISVDMKKGARGRIYIPQQEMVERGITEYDLEDAVLTDKIRDLIAFQVARTEEYFLRGRPLCKAVPSRMLSYELRLTWLGGMDILQKIKKNGYNIFVRPTVTKFDWLRLTFSSLIF